MAVKKKMPKRPKISASLSVWENYHAKCKEVNAHNNKVEADKKKKKALISKKPAGK